MKINTNKTCPTCGSAVIWPVLNRPCSERTAPDPFHTYADNASTAATDAEAEAFQEIARRSSSARWDAEVPMDAERLERAAIKGGA